MIWKTTMLSKSLKWQFQNNQMTPERIVLFELRRGNAVLVFVNPLENEVLPHRCNINLFQQRKPHVV